MSSHKHLLTLEYRGSPNEKRDNQLKNIAQGKSGGSGYCFFTKTRDLSFWYRSKKQVREAIARIRKHTRNVQTYFYEEG